MRISDWSSDVCSSDLLLAVRHRQKAIEQHQPHRDLGAIARIPGGQVERARPKGPRLGELARAHIREPAEERRPGMFRRQRHRAPKRAQRCGRCEESRVGKECDGTYKYRWAPYT